MLDPVSVLTSNIKNLVPSPIESIGVLNFVNVVCDYMEKVQAGPTASPGILIMNRAAMASMLQTQVPVPDSSWISNFVAAWTQGVSLGTITAGTAINPVWVGSAGLDIATLTSPTATITTLSTASTVLQSGLASVLPPNLTAPMPLAEAINAATLAFTFLCIGLSAPPVLVPTPIPLGAL